MHNEAAELEDVVREVSARIEYIENRLKPFLCDSPHAGKAGAGAPTAVLERSQHGQRLHDVTAVLRASLARLVALADAIDG